MKLFKRYYDNKKLNKKYVSRFEDARKMLLIAPHPDDEVIGCGGILVKYSDKFDVICISSSGVAYQNISAKERSNIRIKEFNRVMDYLGIKNHWIFETFGNPPFIESIEKHFYKYAQKLNFLEYDFIFCPYSYDSHPEHSFITNNLLKRLLKENGCSKDTNICFYEVWTPILRPNYYEEIESVIDDKIKLVKMYSSQLIDGWDYDRWIKGLNSYRSMYTRPYKYSEVFRVISMKNYLKNKDSEI